MAQNQIAKISTRHEAIMNHIIANPTQTYAEVAGHFKVTQPWLSVIIHSEAFQEMLKEKQEKVFDASVLQPLASKIEAAAHMTIDRYMDKLPELNAEQLANAGDKLLGKLGFGSRGNGGGPGAAPTAVQINFNHVPREIIDQARSKIGVTTTVGETNNQAALSYSNSEEGAETEGV